MRRLETKALKALSCNVGAAGSNPGKIQRTTTQKKEKEVIR